MLQTTLFCKELTTFLRSVTITNRYFAQNSLDYEVNPAYAPAVAARPYLTPYYMHMYGHYLIDRYTTDGKALTDGTARIKYCYVDMYADSIASAIYTSDSANEVNTTRVVKIPQVGNDGTTTYVPTLVYPYCKPSSIYAKMDVMMYILSEDHPGTTVAFTKDMLANNVLTADRYRLQFHEYKELCTRYPTQSNLVKSIVYSINVEFQNELTTLNNYTLVGYATDLLYSNEQSSLISEMISFLRMFRERWDIKEYTYEELYVNFQWGAIWIYLFQILLKTRIANIKTARVHPDHIWEYLNSNGLEDYRTILSRDQELFLYKNIHYLVKNRGKHSNMVLLSDRILSSKHSDLVTKDLMLCPTDVINTTVPTPEFVDNSVTTPRTPSENAAVAFIPTHVLFEQMNNSGLIGNAPAAIANETTKLAYAPSTYLKTKLVEIKKSAVDVSFINLYLKHAVSTLIHTLRGVTPDNGTTWYTKANHQINLTTDGGFLDLSAKDSLALLFYCLYRSTNTDTYEVFKQTPIPNTFYCPVLVLPDMPTSDQVSARAAYLTNLYNSLDNAQLILGDTKFKMSEFTSAADIITKSGIVSTAMIRSSEDVREYSKVSEFRDRLDAQSAVLQNFEATITGTNDIKQKEAFTHIYGNIVRSVIIEMMPLVQDSATPPVAYATYGDWFDHYTVLKTYIDSMEADTTTSKYKLDSLADILIDGLIGINSSTSYPLNTSATEQYDLLKSLFIQLCSYNVAFMDTDNIVPTTINMSHIGVDTVERLSEHTTYLPYYLDIIPA